VGGIQAQAIAGVGDENFQAPEVNDRNSATNAVQPITNSNTGVSAEPAHGRQLRARHPRRDPTHLLGAGFEDKFIFLTAQMSAKRGLAIFGKPGADAIVAELQQLHYRKVICPVFGDTLT